MFATDLKYCCALDGLGDEQCCEAKHGDTAVGQLRSCGEEGHTTQLLATSTRLLTLITIEQFVQYMREEASYFCIHEQQRGYAVDDLQFLIWSMIICTITTF